MRFNLNIAFSILFLFVSATSVCAQEKTPPFWNDIQNFKKQDLKNPPPQHAILFIGSSSFTRWQDVQNYFPDHTIINRGFGGSTLVNATRYAKDIIFPYHPKQIVIYEGDNDAVTPKISADSILTRFKVLYHKIRSKLPHVQITYISIKPSPSRKAFFPVMQKANWEIKTFLNNEKNTDFVDIWHPMLDDYGRARPELFGDDMLHMNTKGYKIWQKAIQPYLMK